MPEGPNLFARLHKWAARQDENFLTDALAVVLEQMLILAPEVGTRLISRLTGGFIDVPASAASSIELRTQVETGQGRPDLEVCIPQRRVWVEVKVESELGVGQLKRYRVLLGNNGFEQTRLVLLTRYPETYWSEDTRPDLEIRWFEVADWLEGQLHALEAVGEVATFVARQFLDFLRTRGMTLTQVGKHMPEGLRALRNLLNMLFEAAAACRVSATQYVSWEHIGINLDPPKYWLGITFTEPEILWFGTWCRIDPQAARGLGVGGLYEDMQVDGGWRWSHGVELNCEAVHFFSRTKVSQMQWLEAFLRGCLEKARSIETPD